MFDTGTHGSWAMAPASPGVQQSPELGADFGQIGHGLLHAGDLVADEDQDVSAWGLARSLELGDFLDLVEAEAEPPSLRDEHEQRQRVLAVDPIARRGAARRWQDPSLLVQPQGLPADAAPGRHLADQQAVSPHASRVNPALGGKVKRIDGRAVARKEARNPRRLKGVAIS